MWDSVFAQAGHDPRRATSMPIAKQVKILTDHMVNTFGFRDVQVVGARKGSEATPVDHKIARDAMLDSTRAIQDLMASLGQPYEAASDFGRLNLVYDPEGSKNYYGMYSTKGEIRLTGGVNSFGHEWTHAVDHMLIDRLMGAGNTHAFLSQYARGGKPLDTRDPVMGAFAKVLNTIFFDRGAEQARRMDLQMQAAKTDRLGNPTQGAKDAQAKLDQLEGGASQLRIKPTDYRAAAARTNDPGYYGNPPSCWPARTRAYLARKMKNMGADPRGAVMPDEAYNQETNTPDGRAVPPARGRRPTCSRRWTNCTRRCATRMCCRAVSPHRAGPTTAYQTRHTGPPPRPGNATRQRDRMCWAR